MEVLFENLQNLFVSGAWKLLVMWVIGGVLIYLAIVKDMEPSLLLPIGFGAIIMNLPGIVNAAGEIENLKTLELLYNNGIVNELFPLVLFIGIGAMIDFGPLLAEPKMLLFGASTPSTVSSPVHSPGLENGFSPLMQPARVLFPQPEGPAMRTLSPG